MRVFLTFKKLVLVTVFALVGASNSGAKDWRGITPLHSSRADVERLLGPPTINRIDWVVYQIEKERVSVEYSKGPCTVEFSPWNVSSGTVISIWVTPKTDEFRFSDLKLDLSKYKKIRDDHVRTTVHYIGDEEGVEYYVDESKGTVTLVRYFPAAADEPLRCPEPSHLLRETIKFDEYSDIPFGAEKSKLDEFAKQLVRYTSTNYASAEGYILAYGSSRGRNGEAIQRATRAKNYLVNVLRIDPNRIVTRYAGRREKTTIELYLVPAGGPAPLSRPN